MGTRWALSPLALSAEAIVNFRAPQILNQVQHDSGLNDDVVRLNSKTCVAFGRLPE